MSENLQALKSGTGSDRVHEDEALALPVEGFSWVAMLQVGTVLTVPTGHAGWRIPLLYVENDDNRIWDEERTLASSIDDLYKAHFIVHDQLFPVCIFYGRVIRLSQV